MSKFLSEGPRHLSLPIKLLSSPPNSSSSLPLTVCVTVSDLQLTVGDDNDDYSLPSFRKKLNAEEMSPSHFNGLHLRGVWAERAQVHCSWYWHRFPSNQTLKAGPHRRVSVLLDLPVISESVFQCKSFSTQAIQLHFETNNLLLQSCCQLFIAKQTGEEIFHILCFSPLPLGHIAV